MASEFAKEFTKEEVPDLQYGYYLKCYSNVAPKKSLHVVERAENTHKEEEKKG